jgi:hypothetical protein
MKKIGRNDPCPCGSGKKYKHCCLGKTALPDEKGPAQQVMEEMREALNSQEFDSLEEAQGFLDRFAESKNRVSQLDFLGLSSDQVYRMMYHPLEDLGDMLRFNHRLEPGAFQGIPIVKNTLFFLTRLKDLEPLRATAKGNLPLAFVRELHDQFRDPSLRFQFRIRSEEESINVNTLRHVLRMCGWVKKEKNNYSLTKKGGSLVDRGFSEAHFFTLLQVFTRRFNWAFQDRYPSFWIIQGGFVFSLYLLHRKAQRFIEAEDLGDYFIKAFPTSLSGAEGIRMFNPSDTVKNCFSLRFLEHFCEYFGLVDIRREKKTPYGFHLFIKKSSFYDQYINWSSFS